MSLIDYFRPRQLGQAIGVARAVLDDPSREPLLTIGREATAYRREKGEFGRYFRSRAYRRGAGNPFTYLSFKEYWRLRKLATVGDAATVFDDKLAFQRAFEMVPEVALPKFLGHTENRVLITVEGARLPIGTEGEMTSAIRHLLRALPAPTAVFAKPRTGCGGKGVFKLSSSDAAMGIHEAVREGDYVFQRVVRQHPALDAVYAGSLNSIRIITCSLASGPEPACARIRFGRGGSVADNASSGGVAGNIDLATGRISRPCSMHFEYGGTEFTAHPDTGHPLVGLEIPFFSEAVEIALAAARRFPYPITGWDVGITPEGPVLIEGNSRPNYHGDEAVSGGYLGLPVINRLINELTAGKGL